MESASEPIEQAPPPLTPSQGLRIPIFPIARRDGQGRTKNSKPDQPHRTDVLNAEDAFFFMDIQMTVCIHGFWDEPKGDRTPASFVVFTCEIQALGEFRARKMKLQVDFLNAEQSGPNPQPLSNPSIISRGPKIIQRFNKVGVTHKRERGIEGELGADAVVVKPGIKLHQVDSQEYERQYFEEARSAVRHASNTDHRYTKVWWTYTENKKAKGGVSPGFRVAVLLKRENDSPFIGQVKVAEFDAGWRHKGATTWHDFLGKADPEDWAIDPIHFVPGQQVRPSWLKGVEANNLADLETESGIDKQYARVWGVDL
ncbi:hypothetical protein MY11210_006465 [Beauveria gryllotalpidicola]